MSQSQSIAGPSTVSSRFSSPKSSKGEPKSRNKLTDTGKKFLLRYLSSLNGRTPTLAERKRVLAEVQSLPGCEFYKMVNLNSWLAYHGHSIFHQTSVSSVEPSPESSPSRYDTLSPAIQRQLTTLLELERAVDPLTPPMIKMRLWAIMLKPSGADQEEVESWLKERWEMGSQEQIDQEETEVKPSGRGKGEGELLTPAGTATPEPEVEPRAFPTVDLAEQPAFSLPTPTSPSMPQPFVAWPPGPATHESRLPNPQSLPLYLSQDTIPSSSISPRLSPLSTPASAMSKGMTGNKKSQFKPVDATNSSRTSSLQTTRNLNKSSNIDTPPLHLLIRKGLAEYARSPPEAETNLPKTAAEFNALWAKYQHMLDKIEQELQK